MWKSNRWRYFFPVLLVAVLVACSDNKTAKDGMIEYADRRVLEKIVIYVGLAVCGTLAVVFRKMFSAVGKITQHSLLVSIKKDHSRAVTYAATLDIPYTVLRSVSHNDLERIKSKLTAGTIISDYRILHSCSVGAHRLLVFTELSTSSYEINVLGGASDTLTKVQHNFVLVHDEVEETLTIMSDIYTNNDQKFQKFSFLKPDVAGFN